MPCCRMRLLILTVFIGVFFLQENKAQDPCELLPCTFDKKDDPLLCSWLAPGDTTIWKNGEQYLHTEEGPKQGQPYFNHLTHPVKDADQQNVNMTRGHAEVRGTAPFELTNDLALSSAEFEVPDDGQVYEFRFKYWLATYEASLKLCLDDTSCSNVLFETEFIDETTPLSDEGPLRAWRPCDKVGDGVTTEDWDCSVDIRKSVEVPAGTHTLHFVAAGLHLFSAAAVDSFAWMIEGEYCADVPTPPPPVCDCWSPDVEAGEAGESKYLSTDVLGTGTEDNWDGTERTCSLLCVANDECASVVVYTDRDPPECHMFATTCADSPDVCYDADEATPSYYFEKLGCLDDGATCDTGKKKKKKKRKKKLLKKKRKLAAKLWKYLARKKL